MKTITKVLLVSMLLCLSTFQASAQQMRDITTQKLVEDMGLGVNLGNTFESQSSNVNNIETAWGSPAITQEIIAVYPSVGFKTVRVPVRWTNAMSGNNAGGTYTINPTLLNRVQEVVDWILDEDMYVILNQHHEKDWMTNNMCNDSAEVVKKYERIWEQIAERFKSYGDKLVFEAMNEEAKWECAWEQWGSKNSQAEKERAFGFLHNFNQRFVNLVRGSGGNNDKRHLLLSAYDVNIDLSFDSMAKWPNDNRFAVSIHYYDPFSFTHSDGSSSWSWAGTTMAWGTSAEVSALNNAMNKLKTNFVDKGTPVIIGEYGVAWEGLARDQAEVRKYTLAVAQAAHDRGILPVLWDTQLNEPSEPIYYFNRRVPEYPDKELVAGFKTITGSSSDPTRILGEKMQYGSSAVIEIYNLRGNKVYGTLPSGVYIEKRQGMPNRIFIVK